MAAQYFTPQYITYEDVYNYLKGKITIGDADTEFSIVFLNDLCAKGENVVEQDLSYRYYRPFQDNSDGTFTSLPTTTQAYIVNLCIYQAAILILSIAFGRNSAVVGDNYIESLELLYNREKQKLMAREKQTGQYITTPLPGLKINTNSYTGIMGLPAIRVVNPLLVSGNMKAAISRLTRVTKLPFMPVEILPLEIYETPNH